MKRIIILLTLILLLTGCSVKYDITITDTEKIKEQITITVDNETALKSSNSLEEYLDYYSNIYTDNQGYGEFAVKTKKGKEFSKFIVKNTYNNLNDYTSSFSFLSMFNKASIERVGNYVTVTTSENEYLKTINGDEFLDEEFFYDDFQISIKFYNKVVNHNADYVDEKNNIYTWDVTKNNPKEYMTFKYSNEKRYDVIIKDWIMINLLPIIIIGTFLVFVIGFIIYILIVRKNNDRI